MSIGSANRQIARAAGTVMLAFALSNLTGLVRQVLVSRAFGTGAEIDAFNAAARLPDLLFNLVAGGALASAFIPTCTGFLTREDRHGAWQLASSVVNLVILLLVGISALAAVFAPQVVRYGIYLLAPGLDPTQQALTVSLLRILLISPVIFGVSGLLMGMLNAHQVFLLPALAPTMYWLGMIFGVLALAPRWGIHGLAWGAVLGAGLHLGVQLPALGRIGGRYFATLGLRSKPVRQVARLMAPRLFGVGIVQLNFLVNTMLASAQPQGSLTALQIAWAVMTMPQVIIAQAIAIAALPTFSAQVARGRPEEMRASLAATLRGVILLSLPASLGLVLLRQPVVALLFQRGEFDAHSTDLVAWALLWYSAGLVGHALVEVLSRAFYAMQDTRTPVVIGAAAMSLNLVFSVGFSALFNRLGWFPHGGLALGNSLATALETIGLLFLMRARLKGLEGRRVLLGVGQAVIASLLMALGLWLWPNLVGDQPAWLAAGGGVALGGGVYALAVLFVGVPEARALLKWIERKLRKSIN
ncbi:MAG TPA: murein biosynthesis integral membrane protein MurJ [Anaerolineales bacterium]|nr:murein biosynthesis integral membrane protein MurJ [Anaerolineales bacterium]